MIQSETDIRPTQQVKSNRQQTAENLKTTQR